jgi:hypothetical protein
MDAMTVLAISELLMVIGVVSIFLGLIFLGLALKYVRPVKLKPSNGTFTVNGPPPIIAHDVGDWKQELMVSWKEKNNKEVTVSVVERTESRVGIRARVYAELTSANGLIGPELSKGGYFIAFSSPDKTIRDVEFQIQPIEFRMPFKEQLPIALALLTIGTVLLVNGLGIYLRT